MPILFDRVLLRVLAASIVLPLSAQEPSAPLTFDKDKVPFSTISSFVYRGDNFFYHRFFETVQEASDKEMVLKFDIEANRRKGPNVLSPLLDRTDLTPSGWKGTFHMSWFTKGWRFGNDSTSQDTFSVRENGDRFLLFSADWRAFQYFGYKYTPPVDTTDPDASSDARQLEGELRSGLIGFGGGVYNEWLTPSASVTYFYEKHVRSESYIDSIDAPLRTLFDQRYNEVKGRLQAEGFRSRGTWGYAFVGYSPRLHSGVILAKDYYSADIDYASAINSNGAFAFSQGALNVIRTVKLFWKPDLLKWLRYRVKANFLENKFRNLENVVSDAAYTGRILSDSKGGETSAGLRYRIRAQYDHTHSRLALVEAGLDVEGILGFSYQYTNPKIFLPDTDRLYRHTFRAFIRFALDLKK